MVFNPLILAASALIPLVVGFVWYNPKVLGNAWMEASDMTEEKMKGANMAVIFGLTFVFSFLLAFALNGMVNHVNGFASMMLENADPNAADFFKEGVEKYGNSYRTFKHGVLHGVLGGIALALPILGVNALFERKGFKYIAINVGFWVVCMALMGGIICQFS